MFLVLRASWNDVEAVAGCYPFGVGPSCCSVDIRSLEVAGIDSFVVVEVVVASAHPVVLC